MAMRNASAWAIKNPIPPIIMFMILLFLGVAAFIKLPINNNPDVSFPLVSVFVTQPGAAPSEIETQITQRVEGAVAGIGNVRNITSRTVEGMSSTFIEFRIGTPIDRAVNDVRDAVSKVRSDLPEGIEEPVVERQDIEGGAIAYYAVGTTDMSAQQLSWFVDNTLVKRLLTVNGVAQVGRSGGVNREVRIDLDPARMQALGLTAASVNQQLRLLNIDAPGGRTQIGGAEQAVRVLGGAKTAQALADTRIALPGGRTVRLADLADVRDGTGEQRTITRLNGREVTSFGVFKAKGASDVTTMEAVEKVLKQIETEHPKIKLTQTFTSVTYTKEQYDGAIHAMIEGAFLAVVVVWFFLRDWRATMIAAVAIPLSVIPAFWFMELMGFTLNTLSLLALSLVAGILVDDAIVEIENIVRHMNMGKSAWQASLDAADEIGLAVVATTMSIIAVFAPVSFMGGISGQYFKSFGLTVAAAVFMSLLVARLITPVMAAYFLKPGGVKPHAEGRTMDWYLRLLKWCIHNRWKTIGGGFAFFVLSIGLMVVIPKGFLPPLDFGFSQVQIELAPGARVEDTARVSAQVTKLLKEQPEVTDVFELIAEDQGEPRTGQLFVTLTDRKERDLTVKEWEQKMAPQLRSIPDARINFQSQGFGGGRDLTVQLTADDPGALERAAAQLEKEMQGSKVMRDARINGDLQRPEVVIKPRFDLAAELGVSVASLSQTIRIATLGDIPQNLAKFSVEDRQVPIRVRLVDEARTDLSTIENLPVPTASGATVPLKSVADITFGQGPSKIRRYNQSRRIVLGADLQPGISLGEGIKALNELPTMKNLPAGVRKVEQGDAEFMGELLSGFVLALTAGTLLVFAVLVLLYKRFFSPLTNMGSLLLAPGGAVILLLLTGYEMTMPVFIGILMLFGIVAKNSILLIDFAIEAMREGVDRDTAIIDAGHKRAQPIVMTTFAMIAGMMPIALGWGADAAFRAPMAIAVIGGLITSTALTLVIVPAAFTVMDDIEKWLAPKFGKRLHHKDMVPAGSAVHTPAE
jgi:hydrophobe/amphiphile efflux-1 (HAE1) family protein